MIRFGRGGIYIHNGILLSHKKEQNNAICSNLDGTRDSHTELSKSERERQITYDITYLESNIWHKGTFPQKRKSNALGEETCGCQGGGGGSGMDWEFGISRCKLLHLQWIGNESLLCSTGNCIQSLEMENDGGYCEKKNV